jgi:nuclear pore complex protein Nup155
LLIYHAADYRSLPDIRSTWTNLVEQIHQQAIEANNQSPWELVAITVENIGRRVNLSENVFPVQQLVPLLLDYDLRYYTHDTASSRNASEQKFYCASITWVLDIFIKLGCAFEPMIGTLEGLWYSQEAPFGGRNRKLLVKWIIYLVEEWGKISSRQGLPFGGEENAIGLADCLRVVLGANEIGRETVEDRTWLERGRAVRELVEGVAR